MSGTASNEELLRACATLRAAGSDAALLASVPNVTYVSQLEAPVPVGALPALTWGPWLALIGAAEGTGWLVVPDFAAAPAREHATGFEVLGFETFDSFAPTDPATSYRARLEEALGQAGLRGTAATIAIEPQACPAIGVETLRAVAPAATLADAGPPLTEARWTKTEREIRLLRQAAHLADVAHNTLAELCRTAGQSEIEMWAEIGASTFTAAGHDFPLTGELVTGPRTNTVAYPNGPRQRRTESGDAALMDLSGRIDGYWFDCTNTHLVGGVEPTAEQRRYARASQDACEAAMAALKPGAMASDAAAAAERAFAQHGLPTAHYSGHQIGVTVNELPRLVPYDHSVIEPGMVFSVEPGAYQGPEGNFGARSEKMVLVTEQGPDVLSTFAWGIS